MEPTKNRQCVHYHKLIVILLVGMLSLFSCMKEDIDIDTKELVNYEEHIKTYSCIYYNNDSIKLKYGQLKPVGVSGNIKTYLLQLYNISFKNFDSTLVNFIPGNAFVNLSVEMNGPNAARFTEGNYIYNASATRNLFTVTKATFYRTLEGSDSVVEQKATRGSLLLQNNVVYPFTGFNSRVLNLTFDFDLEDGKKIWGFYTGRVFDYTSN